jgi:hypothetical protein
MAARKKTKMAKKKKKKDDLFAPGAYKKDWWKKDKGDKGDNDKGDKGAFDDEIYGYGGYYGSYGKGGVGGYGGGYGGYGGWNSWSSYRTPGKSASSFWASSWSYGKDDKWKYKNILYNVANAANVPANSIGSGERQFRVKWASEEKEREGDDSDEESKKERVKGGDDSNTLTSDTIVLSPDVIDDKTTRKNKWTQNERQDVLIGDALTLAAMKATAHSQSEYDVESAPKDVRNVAAPLWCGQETIVAEKAVLDAYPGFKTYYATYRDYWSDKDARETLEKQIAQANSLGVNWLDGAVQAAKFEMLYPDQKLDLPKAFREAVDAVKAAMPMDAPAKERGRNACKAAREVMRILPQNEEKKEPDSESGPDGEKGDDGDEEGEGKGTGKKSKMPAPPKFGMGRDRLDDDEENSNLEFERDSENKMSKSDEKGVILGDTIEREIMDEDTWKGGTVHRNVEPDSPSNQKYKQLVSKLKPTINGVRNRLKLRQEKPNLMLHGLRRGGIDEGSLYKLAFGEQEPLIFEQPEIVNRVDMAFGILIDESGSMAHNGRIQIARDVAIVLAESLKDMEGLELAVLGHTGQGCCHGPRYEGMVVHHYYTPENKRLEALSMSEAFCQNLDGYAMLETIRKMLAWYPHVDSRTLFVVSDGLPEAHGYGGESSREHMGRVCGAARRAGVDVFGIGIDNAYDEINGDVMYGPGKYVVLENARNSMALMCNFIVNAVRKSCVVSTT